MDAKMKVVLIAVAASFLGGKIAPTIAGFVPDTLGGEYRPLIIGVAATGLAAYALTMAIK